MLAMMMSDNTMHCRRQFDAESMMSKNPVIHHSLVVSLEKKKTGT